MRTELSSRERIKNRPKNNDPLEDGREKCSQYLRKLSRNPQKVISIVIDKKVAISIILDGNCEN